MLHSSIMECDCCYEIKPGIKCTYNHFICIDCRKKNGSTMCFICSPLNDIVVQINEDINHSDEVTTSDIICEFFTIFFALILSMIFVTMGGYYYRFLVWCYYNITSSDKTVSFNIIEFSIFEYIGGLFLGFFTISITCLLHSLYNNCRRIIN